MRKTLIDPELIKLARNLPAVEQLRFLVDTEVALRIQSKSMVVPAEEVPKRDNEYRYEDDDLSDLK